MNRTPEVPIPHVTLAPHERLAIDAVHSLVRPDTKGRVQNLERVREGAEDFAFGSGVQIDFNQPDFSRDSRTVWEGSPNVAATRTELSVAVEHTPNEGLFKKAMGSDPVTEVTTAAHVVDDSRPTDHTPHETTYTYRSGVVSSEHVAGIRKDLPYSTGSTGPTIRKSTSHAPKGHKEQVYTQSIENPVKARRHSELVVALAARRVKKNVQLPGAKSTKELDSVALASR